jgi:5-(aminomethyl)-3-furanmethanol phosphate kinase
MAVAAMDQFGWELASQGMATTHRLMLPTKTCILLPYCVMRTHDPLPHTWNVTSDTIAAWVAGILGADLLVLKSVDGITLDGVLQAGITEPVESEVVDPCFIPYVIDNRIRVTILNGAHPELIEKYLRGERVYGTAIGTGAGTTF